MLLKEGILAAVAAIRVCICKMLTAIEFNNETGSRIEQIHFHIAPAIKRDWQLDVQFETAGCFRK